MLSGQFLFKDCLVVVTKSASHPHFSFFKSPSSSLLERPLPTTRTRPVKWVSFRWYHYYYYHYYNFFCKWVNTYAIQYKSIIKITITIQIGDVNKQVIFHIPPDLKIIHLPSNLPVYNDHPLDPRTVVVVDGWSLFKGYLFFIRSIYA